MPSSHFLCWFSALIFVVANALAIAYWVHRKSTEVHSDAFTQLLPEVIQQSWLSRYDDRALFFASGFVNSTFWILFCIPVMELAWILSRHGTQAIGANVGICVFALGGAFTEWLSHLFWLGVTTTSFAVAQNFNLDQWLRSDLAVNLGLDGASDGMGWRELELDHIITSGMIWIVDSFEWLCLAGIFLFSFYSVHQWRKEEPTCFSPQWNALGLFIGFLSIIEFAFEIAAFEGMKVAEPIVIIYASLNRFIFIPAWLISLGYQLPKAHAKHLEMDAAYFAGELDLMEQLTASDPKNFTIDDDDDENNNSIMNTDDAGGLQPPSAAIPSGPSSPPAEAFAANPFSSTNN
jgi:hypothetical protein